MRSIFVDTSGIVAAMNSKDKHHQEAAGIFRALAREGCVLTISNYIRAETHALLVGRSGRDVALRFLEDESWRIERVEPEDEGEAMKILRSYQDKSFSLTDATSFVLMRRLGIDTAVAFDRHFRQYGVKVLNGGPS